MLQSPDLQAALRATISDPGCDLHFLRFEVGAYRLQISAAMRVTQSMVPTVELIPRMMTVRHVSHVQGPEHRTAPLGNIVVDMQPARFESGATTQFAVSGAWTLSASEFEALIDLVGARDAQLRVEVFCDAICEPRIENRGLIFPVSHEWRLRKARSDWADFVGEVDGIVSVAGSTFVVAPESRFFPAAQKLADARKKWLSGADDAAMKSLREACEAILNAAPRKPQNMLKLEESPHDLVSVRAHRMLWAARSLTHAGAHDEIGRVPREIYLAVTATIAGFLRYADASGGELDERFWVTQKDP